MARHYYAGRTPELSPELLNDIFVQRPVLMEFMNTTAFPDVYSTSAAQLILGIFGKNWYVRTEDYEQAGLYRDLQKFSANDGIEQGDFTGVDVAAIEECVVGMFRN